MATRCQTRARLCVTVRTRGVAVMVGGEGARVETAEVGGREIESRKHTFYTRDVYSTCMSMVRTNIELEDDYVQAIMDRYGVRTKTAAVDLALRHLAGQPLSREEALAMRGARAIGSVPADRPPRSRK